MPLTLLNFQISASSICTFAQRSVCTFAHLTTLQQMPALTSCRSCGATDAVNLEDAVATCKYCSSVLYDRPLAQMNPFARSGTSATGNNTKSYLVNGILLFTAISLFALYLDSPRWFRSDFAITLWAAIIPFFTLLWTFNLHPQRRIPVVIALVILANALPFLVGVIIKEPRKLWSDDLWGITALFAGCSLVAFLIGAVLNNYRPQLAKLTGWFAGK
jgi:hypothetical protein